MPNSSVCSEVLRHLQKARVLSVATGRDQAYGSKEDFSFYLLTSQDYD